MHPHQSNLIQHFCCRIIKLNSAISQLKHVTNLQNEKVKSMSIKTQHVWHILKKTYHEIMGFNCLLLWTVGVFHTKHCAYLFLWTSLEMASVYLWNSCETGAMSMNFSEVYMKYEPTSHGNKLMFFYWWSWYNFTWYCRYSWTAY